MDQPQSSYDHDPVSFAPTRGITWVLSWAAAIAVLGLAIVTLADFAYCVAAELRLSRSAKAAALEATLPRASYLTVCSAALRRLEDGAGLANDVNVTLLLNGTSVGRVYQPKPGDRIAVTLTVPKCDVQPYWLQALSFLSMDEQIMVRAQRDLPGKEFPPRVARPLLSAR